MTTRAILFLAVAILAGRVDAQIKVTPPSPVQLGEPVYVECDLLKPDNEVWSYAWTTTADSRVTESRAHVIPKGQGKLGYWVSTPGEHVATLHLIRQPVVVEKVRVPHPDFPDDRTKDREKTIKRNEGEPIVETYHQPIVVQWAGVTPGPGPGPQPPVKTLRDLLPDPSIAAPLADFHDQWAATIERGAMPSATAAQYRAGYKAARASLATSKQLPATPEFDAEVAKRVDATLPPSGALTATHRAGLVAALRKVAVELGQGPQPPPGPQPPTPQPGKRQIYILHESDDNTNAFGIAVTQLRSGDAWKYLKERGHPAPLIVDEESEDETGGPSQLAADLKAKAEGLSSPVVFIVDPSTAAVVHKQSFDPATVTAQQIIDILKTHGG